MAKLKTKNKIWLFRGLSLLVTFAPIICEMVIHREVYFATKAAGWSFTIGGIVAVVLVVLAMLGKLSKFMGSEIRIMGTVFVLSMLLEPILLNLKLLSFLLLCGMSVSGIFIKPRIKKLLKRKENEETASVLKEALNGK